MKNVGLNLDKQGFEIIEAVYNEREIESILSFLSTHQVVKAFGIREFLIKYPELIEQLFTPNLLSLIQKVSPNCNKLIKSIYFDKPPSANWIVNWHQDITINLHNKIDIEGYKNWRVKEERVVVQPNLKMLENIFTIRIHLDHCTRENGALRVITNSHKKGVINIKEWAENKEGEEQICEVGKGGVLLMKPLTLHSSRRTENQQNRRVIHLEFTNADLPKGLYWKEKLDLNIAI